MNNEITQTLASAVLIVLALNAGITTAHFMTRERGKTMYSETFRPERIEHLSDTRNYYIKGHNSGDWHLIHTTGTDTSGRTWEEVEITDGKNQRVNDALLITKILAAWNTVKGKTKPGEITEFKDGRKNEK